MPPFSRNHFLFLDDRGVSADHSHIHEHEDKGGSDSGKVGGGTSGGSGGSDGKSGKTTTPLASSTDALTAAPTSSAPSASPARPPRPRRLPRMPRHRPRHRQAPSASPARPPRPRRLLWMPRYHPWHQPLHCRTCCPCQPATASTAFSPPHHNFAPSVSCHARSCCGDVQCHKHTNLSQKYIIL